jgi:threonine aldolase
MIIDLRSDTVTRPTIGMKKAMMEAPLGDDVFGEDPTVNAFEKRVAQLFGHEAALFCASGTMANQIAVKAHTQPMDEIILDKTAHIYYYETAGFAFHSGVSVKLVEGERGIMTAEQVLANIQPDFDWLPKTNLVSIENTTNKGGGACYSLAQIQAIKKVCTEHHLPLHMDGARVFNAMTHLGYTAEAIGSLVDSASVCFSKGLGSPAGSLLIGKKDFIRKARRIRKVMGGGMRQVGMLAAACNYALDHHVKRLIEDHEHVVKLANVLKTLPWVSSVKEPQTNILIFSLDPQQKTVVEVLEYLKNKGILAVQFGPNDIRFVTHLDINSAMIDEVVKVLREI